MQRPCPGEVAMNYSEGIESSDRAGAARRARPGPGGSDMPGGRLTYQDREQIAAGLAAGLSHAEIARRLNRPTSTVSREVQRNGGHAGYRAGQAHRATERRAQRRRTPGTPSTPGAPAEDGDGSG